MDIDKEYIQILLIRKYTGTISAHDQEWLDATIRNDPEIRQQWEAVNAEMNAEEGKRFFAELDNETSWEQVEQQIRANALNRKRFLHKIRVAAAVFFLFVISGVYWYTTQDNKVSGKMQASRINKGIVLKLSNGDEISLKKGVPEKFKKPEGLGLYTSAEKLRYTDNGRLDSRVSEWATLQIPQKLDYKVQLADGTEVWLNSSSSLRFPYRFNGSTREVYLEGEGYFQVTKNAEKPFIVHAGATSVRVLGTVFNINAYAGQQVSTSLVEGSVLSSAGDLTEKLHPGEQSVYRAGRFDVRPFDRGEVLAWTKGVHYFHKASLQTIADVIFRWYDVRVAFDNPNLASHTFSGAIDKHMPLQEFMQNVETTSNVHSQLINGVLHMK